MAFGTGFDARQLQRARDLLKQWADEDRVPAAAACVGRGGQAPETMLAGAATADSLFLVASLTKPLTVAAVMILVERGLVTLDDRVAAFVPGFAVNGKETVTIRHLMTHTSGLPDMPPDNLRIRREQRPLAAFIESTLPVAPLFEPGAGFSYQSMGTAMLGEVLRVVAGVPLPEFLARELFDPLGLRDTSLGWNPATKDRILPVRLPPGAAGGNEFVWNTPYWLGLGAPWGGLITSATDYARILRMFLGGGRLDETRVLGAVTVSAMTTNQLAGMQRVPEEHRRCRPWALGWQMNWPGSSKNFGDLLGPRTYGHWGSTGTLAWCDPDADAYLVLLTTQPQDPEGRFLARFSNAARAAFE